MLGRAGVRGTRAAVYHGKEANLKQERGLFEDEKANCNRCALRVLGLYTEASVGLGCVPDLSVGSGCGGRLYRA
jgi:hypothetical protein